MLRWFSSYLGQEQTQSPQPRFLLSKCIIHHLQPPNPTTAPPTVPHSAAAPRAVPGQPLPSPGPGSRPPSGRPIHPAQAPRTLLFTSMVPRQPLPAPCRWLRFILRPDPAAASADPAARRERRERARGRRARDAVAARAPPNRHLQRDGRGSGLCTELRSAGSSHGGTESRTGGAAGGDAAPSLRVSAAGATAEEEGAEQKIQAPQSCAPPPPRQARAHARTRLGPEPRSVHAPTCSLRRSLGCPRSAHTQ